MDVRKTYIEARGTGTQKKNQKREKQNTYLPSTGKKKVYSPGKTCPQR